MMNWLLQRVGLYPAIIGTKSIGVALVIWLRDMPGMSYILAAALIFYVPIVLNNFRIAFK